MPTLASARYPKPTSWDEFEDICLSSFKIRWRSPNLHRHGRQGQAQQGVDIFGQDNLLAQAGIQCKNTVGGISTSIIDREIAEAEKFCPPLNSLYIATTADRDASLQAYVRNLSKTRAQAGKFSIDIVFWADIEHDLSADPAEVAKHYPQFFRPAPAAAGTVSSPYDRDVQTLIRLLSVIDIDATNLYFERAPKCVNFDFLEQHTSFSEVINLPTFHICDVSLKNQVDAWLIQWAKLANLIRNAPYRLLPDGCTLSFDMPGDFIRNPEHRLMYADIEKQVRQFFRLQRVFCDFVRTHFKEVDLAQTSLRARKSY